MKATSRYIQIINYYEGLIEAGQLEEGDKMPTEDEIGVLFGVSRITVRKALDDLMQRGFIYKIQGKGSFISSKKADMQLNQLVGFSEEMRALGLIPSAELIEVNTFSPSKAIAKELEIGNGQNIYRIVRLRCGDEIPMALESVHLPFYRFAGIEKHDLSKSLYELLRNTYGCEIFRAKQSIRAGAAPSNVCKLLGIPPGSPVLIIRRTTYGINGLPIEYVESVYRGDKYVFNVTLSK